MKPLPRRSVTGPYASKHGPAYMSFLLFLLFSFFSFSVLAQNRSLTGRVVSATGEALAGASVRLRSGGGGVNTDTTGAFTINVPTTATTLVISYVGFNPQEVVVSPEQTNLLITLQPSGATLDQVVVVGYGTQRRRDLTGSVASVRGAELAKQPVQTATQAVQGRVAGVQVITSGQPNALPTVRVRGTGTMLGGAEPLYVVDGVITTDIRNINTADIVSMDILKDASATAIYGMRAANGVLLITTKKGRTGRLQIAYDANIGIREATSLVDMAGPNQYANYLNEASVYYGSGDSLVPAARLASGQHTDWYDAILRRGLQQNHNLSLSGGGENITYFFSVGYLGDEGILKTNKLDRFTLRSNNEYKLSKKLTLSSLVSYAHSRLRNANLGVFNDAYRAAPYVPAKLGNRYGNTSEAGNVGNPLLQLEKADDRLQGNRIQGTFALDYKPIKDLTLRSGMGVDLEFNRSTTYGYRFFSDTNTFLTPGGNQQVGRSSLGVANTEATRWVWDNTATYSRRFDRHNLTVLAGVTAEAFRFNELFGQRFDVPENRDQWFLNAGSTSDIINRNTGDKFTRNSYIGRLNYGYNDRYLLTATFRADGTSRFSRNNRWGYFPSIALGWNMVNEAFMASQRLFKNLKLRASYGRVGNDQIPTSLYYSLATINVPYYLDNNRLLGISFNNLNDPNVRWEVTDELDIGADFGLLNNRLTGEVDWYDKKTKDALIFVNIPAILGDENNQYITNAANFRNTGVEVSLNWNDRVGRDWTYSFGGNVAFNKNEVIGLGGGQALFAGNIGGNQGFVTYSQNGNPIGSFYVLRTIGILQTEADVQASGQAGAKIGDLRYEDINGDKVINSDDRVFLGSYIPKVTYGLNGSLNYQQLDFSFNTYGTLGSKIYNGKKATRGADPRDNIEASVARNRWTPNNPNTGVPRANLGQLPASSYFVENGNFFRLNNLTLGYTFRSEALERVRLNNLRVYFTGQNLFTLTNYSGFTPELQSDSPLSGGIELNSYPTTRTFALGVNLGF